jgi:DNA-binding MarR family transcriptional regulator
MGKKARAKQKREARGALLEGATLVKDDAASPRVAAGDGRGTTDDQAAPFDASQLATRLNSVAIHLLRRLAREDTKLGLSAARLSALSVLVFGGPRTLGQLAKAEGVTPPSMTRLVTAMEQEGLVERQPSPTDGRSIVVKASPIGEEILVRGREQRVVALSGWLADLSRHDLLTLEDASGLLEGLLREQRTPDRP